MSTTENTICFVFTCRNRYPHSTDFLLRHVGMQNALEYLIQAVTRSFPEAGLVFLAHGVSLAPGAAAVLASHRIPLVSCRAGASWVDDVMATTQADHLVLLDVFALATDMSRLATLLEEHLRLGAGLSLDAAVPRSLAPEVVHMDVLARTPSLAQYFLADFSTREERLEALPKADWVHHGSLWGEDIPLYEPELVLLTADRPQGFKDLLKLIFRMKGKRLCIEDVLDQIVLEGIDHTWSILHKDRLEDIYNTGGDQSFAEYLDSGRDTVLHWILGDAGLMQGRRARDCRILEIGCANGRILYSLADHFGTVYGMDISYAMVEEAKYNCRDKGNVFVAQNNGYAMDMYEDGLFDVAFSLGVFQHVVSARIVQSYLLEMQRVLRPGGRAKIHLVGREPGVEPPKASVFSPSRNGRSYTEDEVHEMLARAGLEFVSLTADPYEGAITGSMFLNVVCGKPA